uniref:2-aminoethanethiol dioxygenase n=1 Tax=Photinus pyralis TaxID=7054 RepID=A0A1Y1JVC2_PHOPY
MSQMSALFKQAITTFTCKKEIFHQNLEILHAVLDKITADDVDLHPQFMKESLWMRPNKAPVTYIDIFEDDKVSMGVFILKPGMRLPLHDHPQMYGLIKVIAGTIRITSFSLYTELLSENQHKNRLESDSVMAERNLEMVADASSEPCMLDPNKGNLHEIESVGGPAAFLDVLSPPYRTPITGNGPRLCTYYKVIKEMEPHIFKLEKIEAPSWYWNDTFPYTGPQVP